MTQRARIWRQRFSAVAILVGAWVVATWFFEAGLPRWERPAVLFVLIIVGAGCCVLGALGVIAIGWDQGLPEVAFIGLFILAVSVLPLVHGITIPGVLVGPNTGTDVSVLLAIPVGFLLASPALIGRRRGARWTVRFWRPWTITSIIALGVLATIIGLYPNAFPSPAADVTITRSIAVASLLGAAAFAWRQLQLAIIGDSEGGFLAATGFLFVAASTSVWFGGGAYGFLFWTAHILDIIGVLAMAAGAALAYRQGHQLRAIIRPLTAQDPLAALELGLDPIVHRFVAELERKDESTRDHVVRTARLATALAASFGLRPEYIRVVGTAAMLHDVGKLEVPDDILKKPGGLSDDEYELMKNHTIWGEQMVADSPVLKSTAAIVRGHHERFDGAGYPDGKAGDDIPLGARIVAVCDAFDAMTHDRHYRTGMSHDQVVTILEQHRGTQWDPQIVDLLLAMVDDLALPASSTRAFTEVGRDDAFCGCADAVPDHSGELVAGVAA